MLDLYRASGTLEHKKQHLDGGYMSKRGIKEGKSIGCTMLININNMEHAVPINSIHRPLMMVTSRRICVRMLRVDHTTAPPVSKCGRATIFS